MRKEKTCRTCRLRQQNMEHKACVHACVCVNIKKDKTYRPSRTLNAMSASSEVPRVIQGARTLCFDQNAMESCRSMPTL